MKLMLNGKEVTGMGHYVMAGDIKDATAEDSNVLSGKAYYNNNGKREGTMPNRGGMSAEMSAGGSVSIPEGYHNGEGVVRAQDLASQTQGTAAAANIEAGYTAWVNGEMVEGAGSMDPWNVVQDVAPSASTYYTAFTQQANSNYIRITDYGGNVIVVPISTLPTSSSNYVTIYCFGSSTLNNSTTFAVRVNLSSGKVRIASVDTNNWKLNGLISKIEEVSLS